LLASVVLAAFGMPWATAGAVDVTSKTTEELRRQSTGLVGVVGLWSQVDDGGPAIQIDGAKWSGKTDPAEARSIGKTLFGSAMDKFVANVTAPAAFPLAVWPKAPNFTGGTLQVQFKMVAGASDQTAGLVFDLQPNGEYLFLRYNTKDGNLALWAYREGERARVKDGTNHAQLPMKAWHALTVTVTGTKVTAAIPAAKLTFEHTLDKPVSGRVGLWTKRDSVTTFRGFSAK
jgi:hypothetical protein